MEKKKYRLLALSLASFTIIAGITAYFTSEDVSTNSFSATTLQIKILEPNWKPNPTVVPEEKIDKDPYIVNIDETPAYVFMQVTVPAENIIIESNSPDTEKGKKIQSIQTFPLFRFINQNDTESYTADPLSSEQKYNAGWYHINTTENKNNSDKIISYTYLYAWTGENEDSTMAVLYPNQSTDTPLFNKVIFCNARENDALSGSLQNIKIEAFAIQTDYLKSSDETEYKAENIWNYLSK